MRPERFHETIERLERDRSQLSTAHQILSDQVSDLETENLALKDFIFRQMNHLDPGSPEEIHLLKQIVDERTARAA